MLKTYILTLIIVVLATTNSFSQRKIKDSIIGTPWIGIHYGANWTGGDLADRYGFNNQLGAIIGYKTNKNWFWGIDANYLFGSKVRMTNLFDDLVDSYGNITDQNGDVGGVYVNFRGFNVNLAFGKIIPIWSPNQNSGIFIQGGAGYMYHKLGVQTQDHVIPTLELDYRKGYDRLTTGLNTHQFLGYAFLSNRGLVNFYAGFYAQQGFTKNQREVFFDQPEIPVDKSMRLDLQFGLRGGWFIPIYKRQPKDFYFD